MGVTVHGEGLGDGIAEVWPRYRGEPGGCESIISKSMSWTRSIVCDLGLVLSCWKDCRVRDCDGDGKAGESSSSDDSAGVIVCVKRGAGLFR